jgi:hypothetical protein
MDRCPICGASVKPENLLRHLNDIHPRHPDMPAIRERLEKEGRETVPRRTDAPIRIRRWHVAIVASVVLLAAGGFLVAPYFDPNREFDRDSCITSEVFHLHLTLHIFIDGNNHLPIPTNVGRTSTCIKPLHTHDGEYDPNTEGARIHVEGPVARSFTLGDFFHVWGKTLTSTRVDTCVEGGGRLLTMTVNGSQSSEYGALVLQEGQVIVLTCDPS